jgi:hypothetical protein
MHDPDEGLGDIDEDDGANAFDDVGEEQVDGPSGEVGEGEEGAFFVGEDADLVLCLDGEVLDDLPDLKRVFINILFVPQRQRPRPTHHVHRRHRALVPARLQLPQQFGVDGDPVEGGGGDDEECLFGEEGLAVGGLVLLEPEEGDCEMVEPY